MNKANLTGLIPAAGNGSRLWPLPFSKELYPINIDRVTNNRPFHPKTTMQYLLENMQKGGARKVFIMIRDGKFDIPAYFGDGSWLGLSIAYLMMGVPFGPPFTINQAYPFVKEQVILFGFPDILVSPDDAFLRLTDKLEASGADAILGLHRVEDPENWDMVRIKENGYALDLIIKSTKAGYDYAWAIMAWNYRFTEFLNDFCLKFQKSIDTEQPKNGNKWNEPIISDVVRAALNNGLTIDTLIFDNGRIMDVGTPERIVTSRQFFH